MNIILADISWQLTVIIITFILAVTIILVAYMFLNVDRSTMSETDSDKLSEPDASKDTILHKIKSEARCKTPTKCTIFIAGSTQLPYEHNAVKAAIMDLIADKEYNKRGLQVEAKNLTVSNRQSDYNLIITAPDTKFFILILDSAIEGTTVTEKEFNLALLMKDRLDIIIFEREYDKPRDNDIVTRIINAYRKAYNDDSYTIKYEEKRHLRDRCYIAMSNKICKLYGLY